MTNAISSFRPKCDRTSDRKVREVTKTPRLDESRQQNYQQESLLRGAKSNGTARAVGI